MMWPSQTAAARNALACAWYASIPRDWKPSIFYRICRNNLSFEVLKDSQTYYFQTYLAAGFCFLKIFIYLFIYKLRTQCHTIIAETVQNSNRHWRRPTQVLKHLRVAVLDLFGRWLGAVLSIEYCTAVGGSARVQTWQWVHRPERSTTGDISWG